MLSATLLAYVLSPGVRHAVGHAEHSVRHAVSRVFDRDRKEHAPAKQPARAALPMPRAPSARTWPWEIGHPPLKSRP